MLPRIPSRIKRPAAGECTDGGRHKRSKRRRIRVVSVIGFQRPFADTGPPRVAESIVYEVTPVTLGSDTRMRRRPRSNVTVDTPRQSLRPAPHE